MTGNIKKKKLNKSNNKSETVIANKKWFTRDDLILPSINTNTLMAFDINPNIEIGKLPNKR